MTADQARTRLLSAGVPVSTPGTPDYDEATRPDNSSVRQRPLLLARPRDADEVAAVVTVAQEHGVRVVVQATGHGAGHDLDDSVVLLDSSGLDGVLVEPSTRRAVVGSGATWSAVNAAAQVHGLLGRAGTAPGVGVAGYTFGGGLGWLTRPFGLASGALRAVDFVDGHGRRRRATDDAPDRTDRDALWAFRGGSPVGIATSLELDLVPVDRLWAGYLRWPAEQAGPVVAAWAACLADLGPDVTSCVSMLLAPPGPPFPEALRGTAVLHLSVASTGGEQALGPLLRALDEVAASEVSTLGPCDAERLAQIHLDPPTAVPALGDGHWLTAGAGDRAADILRSAGIGPGSALAMVELRHVATEVVGLPGAMTTPPGPFLLHAVGPATEANPAEQVIAALDRLRAAVQPVDTGRTAVGFRDGRPDAVGALSPADTDRLAAIRRELDPDGVLDLGRTAARAEQ